MKKIVVAAAAAAVLGSPLLAQATPQEDLEQFRDVFMKRFPGVPLQEYANGIYAIDENRRLEWEAMEDFPPYEPAVEAGKAAFEKPFANGKTYADCFKNGGIGIRQNYPYFDKASGEIRTLEQEINECRVNNGEEPLKWKSGELAGISAYMAYTSRGEKLNIEIPDDPRALEHYNRGKTHFYAKRGQLNFACADCHISVSGMNARANLLSPALGQPTHFPVYRKKWAGGGNDDYAGLGTLHRRYGGCNRQVRAKDFPAQGDEYKALEYFHTYMSNGIEVNAPGIRQ